MPAVTRHSVARALVVLAVTAAFTLTGFSLSMNGTDTANAQQAAPAAAPLNIIAFGAHPDDCDIRAGGTAAKWAALGHKVRFVAVTNGDAGHQSEGGGALAARRRAEAIEAGKRIGVEYVVLDNHDGELLPELKVREQIIRQIRQWKADLVLAPRPNDYHPDHRYTGVLLQDAAFMVTVPNVAPDTPSLRKNPVFMYFQDGFQKPSPFEPHVPCRSTIPSRRKSTCSTRTSRRSTSGCRGSPAGSRKCRRTRPRARIGWRRSAPAASIPRCARRS